MKKFAAIVIALGLVSGVLFFIAGSKLSESGKSLTRLRTIGGKSVAEAYYQEIGRYGAAYSQFAYAMGTATIMISLGFGGVLLSKD
jgi:hypothetical protein